MQPTTMLDINELDKKTMNTANDIPDEPQSVAEATTAPQEQLEKLDSETPKQK